MGRVRTARKNEMEKCSGCTEEASMKEQDMRAD